MFITNNSNHRLIVNNIAVADPDAVPQVELDSKSAGLLFNINHEVQPTLVDIEGDNLKDNTAPDVLINGLINNPIGKTIVVDTSGNILSTNDRNTADAAGRYAIIRTNVLVITANKANIGDDPKKTYTDAVNVDLVQSSGRPIQITANAAGNVHLDLLGQLRDRSINPLTTTFQVPINSITAGGDADLQLEASVQDTKVANAGGVDVAVNNRTEPKNPFFNFYKPDSGSAQGLDLGVFAQESTPIASTYDFEVRDATRPGNPTTGDPGIVAGGNISIQAVNPDAAATRINILGLLNVLGSGHIDRRPTVSLL